MKKQNLSSLHSEQERQNREIPSKLFGSWSGRKPHFRSHAYKTMISFQTCLSEKSTVILKEPHLWPGFQWMRLHRNSTRLPQLKSRTFRSTPHKNMSFLPWATSLCTSYAQWKPDTSAHSCKYGNTRIQPAWRPSLYAFRHEQTGAALPDEKHAPDTPRPFRWIGPHVFAGGPAPAGASVAWQNRALPLEKTAGAVSSVGRVSVLHTDCQGFESLTAHQHLTFRRKAVCLHGFSVLTNDFFEKSACAIRLYYPWIRLNPPEPFWNIPKHGTMLRRWCRSIAMNRQGSAAPCSMSERLPKRIDHRPLQTQPSSTPTWNRQAHGSEPQRPSGGKGVPLTAMDAGQRDSGSSVPQYNMPKSTNAKLCRQATPSWPAASELFPLAEARAWAAGEHLHLAYRTIARSRFAADSDNTLEHMNLGNALAFPPPADSALLILGKNGIRRHNNLSFAAPSPQNTGAP